MNNNDMNINIEKVIDEVLKSSESNRSHMQKVRKEIDKMTKDQGPEEAEGQYVSL